MHGSSASRCAYRGDLVRLVRSAEKELLMESRVVNHGNTRCVGPTLYIEAINVSLSTPRKYEWNGVSTGVG